jgi:hypothetical protein
VNYENKKQGFSFDVPEDWKRQGRGLGFILAGGKVAYESFLKDATVNVTTGMIGPKDTPDRSRRELEMIDFLKSSPVPVYNVNSVSLALSGERNTAYLKYDCGLIMAKGRMISSFHEGKEYVIHTGSKGSDRSDIAIDGIIKSFKFI